MAELKRCGEVGGDSFCPDNRYKMPARSTALASAVRQARGAARTLPAIARPAFIAAASAARPCPSLARASSVRSFSSTPRRAGGNVPARADYKKLTVDDVKAFASFLSTPSSSLFTTLDSPDGSWTAVAEDDLVGYNKDWMDKYVGHSQLLLKPKSTEEVSKIMAYCYRERIAVVPQGGNTGLVGGGTPVYDEVILSTEGMKEIRHFDEVSGESPLDTPSRRRSRPSLTPSQASSLLTVALFWSHCPTFSRLKAT